MRGITISDRDESGERLGFDLRDILDIVFRHRPELVWSISGVEAIGDVQPLEEAAARGPIGTDELRRLAVRLRQTIDGLFVGTDVEHGQRVAVIRAVDSSSFDVESNDPELLKELRNRFRQVVEYDT